MPSATRHNKIAEHTARADEALSAAKPFEAERQALKALMLARQEHDFQRMTSIIPTLLEARMRRLRDAMKGAKISMVDDPVPEDVQPKKGCYLVVPPQVGADARRLRLAALEREVCVVVLCREPLTHVKLVPIVAICPGMSLRTQVRPPKTLDKPDHEWFADAIEALGDFAVDSIDPDMIPQRRVDALLERLDALPEHEGLHHALEQACLEAHAAEVQAQAARAAKKSAQASSRAASGTEDEYNRHESDDTDRHSDGDDADADGEA